MRKGAKCPGHSKDGNTVGDSAVVEVVSGQCPTNALLPARPAGHSLKTFREQPREQSPELPREEPLEQSQEPPLGHSLEWPQEQLPEAPQRKRYGTGIDLRRLGRGRSVRLKMREPAVERARRAFDAFAAAVVPALERTAFHEAYFRLLEEFARGRIRRMMVSVPPQHGKSLGASVLLPAYLLGLDPDLRVAVASYSFALAGRFGQQVQRLMEEPPFRAIFPATWLKGMGVDSRQERTARRTAAAAHDRSRAFRSRGGFRDRLEVLLLRRTGTASALLRSGSFRSRVVVVVHRNEFIGVVHIVFPESF